MESKINKELVSEHLLPDSHIRVSIFYNMVNKLSNSIHYQHDKVFSIDEIDELNEWLDSLTFGKCIELIGSYDKVREAIILVESDTSYTLYTNTLTKKGYE